MNVSALKWALILIVKMLVWIGRSRMGGIPSQLESESKDMTALLRERMTMMEFADKHSGYGPSLDEGSPDGGD